MEDSSQDKTTAFTAIASIGNPYVIDRAIRIGATFDDQLASFARWFCGGFEQLDTG
jgi:hypothetical protein